jgi:Ca-activated chloride channel family protein
MRISIGIALLVMAGACTTQETPEVVEAEDAIVVSAARMEGPPPSPSMVSSAGFAPNDTSRFDNGDPNPVKLVIDEPVSTFSADVDTASYSVVRQYLSRAQMPPSEAVRVEELINYFDYDYEGGTRDRPFRPTVWVTPTPWNEGSQLLHIGVKGYDEQPDTQPAVNVVLLVDVSGSMQDENKLPLLRRAMSLLVDQMGPDDTVAMVTYAGGTRVVLEPTPGDEKSKIKRALADLQAGGSTAGAAGLSLAYELAEENFDSDKVNRIVLATDGDFNVGITTDDRLEDFVARKRGEGIYLSVLGFGMYNLNDQMMQRIAQNGNGIAAYIDTLDEARKVLVREFRSSMFPIAEDLKFQVEFNPSQVSEYRLIGYQTRILDREDFNNDQVDAGDIGSGHTVTAIYEIVRAGMPGMIEPLRYEAAPAPVDRSGELAFLRIRYKAPGADESQLIERPITELDFVRDLDKAPEDARFAAAVAAFGEKLSRTGHADNFGYDEIAELALAARGEDPYGDRVGFVNLVRAAAQLDGDE